METSIVSFTGEFRVWIYDASHSLLLLRRASAPSQRRVDILFGHVRSIEIGIYMDSIRIEEVDREQFTDEIARSKEVYQPGFKTYRITTLNWVGRVIAYTVHWREDDKKWNEPSEIYKPGSLMQDMGKDGYRH